MNLKNGPRLSPREPYPWNHFVAKGSPEARRWIRIYEEGKPRQIRAAIDESLSMCRQGRPDEAHALLETARRELDAPGDWERSMQHVLVRWYLGALAYYFYLVDDLDGAEETSARAHREVEQALDLAPFLLPLAHHCQEFHLQRARIARKRHRWDAMQHHLTVAREMITDQRPLASTSSVGDVYESDIVDYFDALPLCAEEIDYVDRFRDLASRRALLSQFAGLLYALPGFVIRFP